MILYTIYPLFFSVASYIFPHFKSAKVLMYLNTVVQSDQKLIQNGSNSSVLIKVYFSFTERTPTTNSNL